MNSNFWYLISLGFGVLGFGVFMAYVFVTWSNKMNKKSIGGLNVRWPVMAKQTLSPVEIKMYTKLVRIAPEYLIFPQVSMCSIVEVEDGRRNPHFWQMFNRFAKMSVDFLVCDQDFNIMCAIEIDDSSHFREDRQKADRVKSHVLGSSGIRLIRIPANQLPSDTELNGILHG